MTNWKDLRDINLEHRFGKGRCQPKTKGQGEYFQLIKDKIITVCMGPAGCGKTFMPTSLGIEWLQEEKINKIILTRPLITCSSGNDIGILPGSLLDKVNPYLRPLIEVVEDKVGKTETFNLINAGKVEIIPLDVMRGLSFKNSLIIVDEAQNASMEALRMVLTRFGVNCKVVVSGDPTQSDLKFNIPPLVNAYHSLGGINEVGRIILTDKDIVRHPLISLIDSRLSTGGRNFVFANNRDSYYRIDCPYCSIPNWINFGDENDDSVADVEFAQCWCCNKIMEAAPNSDDFIKTNKSPHFVEKGNRRPPIG